MNNFVHASKYRTRTVKYTALHSGKATFGQHVEFLFLFVISGLCFFVVVWLWFLVCVCVCVFFQIIIDHQ